MTTRASLLATASAVLALTGGCGTADIGQARTVAPDPTAVSTKTPTETPTETQTIAPTGPLTMIPEGVRLPHEGFWPAGDPGYTDALPEMCIDPGPDLYPPDTTDHRAAYGTGADESSRGESLGVFLDSPSAERAVEVWLAQIARCGHGRNHDGVPRNWFVAATTMEGTDEAWQAYEVLHPPPSQQDAPPVPFITVARVGNAVYVETSRHDGRFDAAAVAALGRSELTSVSAYVPTLAVFGS